MIVDVRILFALKYLCITFGCFLNVSKMEANIQNQDSALFV